MRYFTLVVYAVFFLPFSANAQKEENIWYFGYNCGIDFNYSPPKALVNSSLYTYEGSASISNKHGNLLFYTEGSRVYDKTHNTMQNGSGLTGHASSTQSALIVPHVDPDSAYLYYVFTTGSLMAYSVVDTTANGGNGAVVSKNNLLITSQAGEKLTAVKHANGRDVWIITHQGSTNKFYVFLLTSNGVNHTPVISATGQNQSNIAIGHLKASPDGKKLVSAETNNHFVELFDFDRATGAVSNGQTLLSGDAFYGAEFSLSGRYLYVPIWPTTAGVPYYLYQFNMRAGNFSDVQASKTIIYTFSGFNPGNPAGMQMAPDGRIYIAMPFGDNHIATINEPEKAGTACDFVLKSFNLAPKMPGACLPNFFHNYSTPDIGTGPITCGKLDFDIYNTGDTNNIISSRWDYGDGTTATGKTTYKTYAKHGTYTLRNIIEVRGRITYTDTLYKTIKTIPSPDARIERTGANNCVAENLYLFADSTKFPDSTAFKSSRWRYSDTGVVHSNKGSVVRRYYKPGTYKITLIVTATNNCTDTAQDSIVVRPSAHTSFTTSGQRCFSNHQLKPLHATNVDTPGAITGYLWDFGDGTNSSLAAPSKTYVDTGTYKVQLVAVEKNGCNDTFVSNYTVLPSPKASFTAGDVCYKDSTIIKNTTTIAKGGLTYKWNYGDGNTSAAFETNRLYTDTGSYTIKLVVISDSLCTDSVQKIIKVKPKPNAAFTYSGRCALSPFVFTDNSMRFNIAIINNQWFFGDGNSFTTSGNTQYTYPMAGLYTAKLVTEAVNGCKDSAVKQVNSNPLPVVSLNTNKLEQCLKNNLFDFIYSSTISTGTIKSFLWYFDNSAGIISPATISRKYTQPGQYTIKIIAESDSGCFDSARKNITVHPQVKVDVTINDTAQCFNRHEFDIINNSTINGIGTISKYNWLFSDNSSHNGISPSPKKFATEGNYSVHCIMETDKGCLDTFQQNLMVYFSPSPGFEVKDICLGEDANFNNTTADPDATIVRWDWDFGDGKSSTQKSPLYKYTATGNYSIRLISTTEKGCKDTLEKYFPNLVKPIPQAYFEDTLLDSYERFSTYKFTNGSAGASNYLWDFGDGTIATDFYPTKVYNTVGHYLVTLKVENQWGCADKFERKLFVMPEMAPIIPNAFTPGKGDDLNSVFRVEGVYVAKEFNMDIFNRWGERIYSTQEPMRGWDGTYNQIPANDGMYMYHVRIMDLKNKVHIYYGSFTLLR